jgi:hypothetical protein
MLFRLYNPEVFQGSLRKKHYFEGWYFKHVTRDPSHSFSFIPGISLTENDSHAFIQVMNGYTGKTSYIRYPLDEFKPELKRMAIRVGGSEFTNDHVHLDINSDNIMLTGQIDYHNMVKYPKRLLSPGIMGWYSFIPFMECNHGIMSVIHDLSGSISFDGNPVDFSNGKGYIEKDWGTSFPEAWIWIQSHSFAEHDTSFSFSIAKIPWMGSFFIGFISFLYFGGKFYLFSTYNKSRVIDVSHDETSIEISVASNRYSLKVTVIKNSFGDLRAPVSGEMSRRIMESNDSEVHLQLIDKSGKKVYEGTGKNVGLEIIEKIFDYI